MQAHSDPTRENDPNTLPDVETFYLDSSSPDWQDWEDMESGWYWWSCIPGCLPDSEPIGPFSTEEEALADSQYEAWEL